MTDVREAKPVSQAIELFRSVGYDLVHTWRESHGNGGQHFLENDRGAIKVVCFDRQHHFTNTYDERQRGSYKMAERILADLKQEDEEDREYEPVSKENVSACYTASWFDVREKHHYRPEYWRVHQIAGHGSKAVKLGDADIEELGYSKKGRQS